MSLGLAPPGVRIMSSASFSGSMSPTIVDVGEIDFDLPVFCGVFGDVRPLLGGDEPVLKAPDEPKRENPLLVGEVETGEIVSPTESTMP